MFKPLRPESDELLGLDALRFIAAMGIVIGHALPRTHSFSSVDARPLGILVDLFFLISGYVIAHVYTGRIGTGAEYRRFLVKRAARLVPLHWLTFATAGAIGVAIWLSGAAVSQPELYEPTCALPNALLLHAMDTCPHLSFNTPSWSISAEAGMYVLAPLIFLAGRSRLVGWTLFAVLFAGLTEMDTAPWWTWKSQGGVIRALPSFLLGTLLYRDRAIVARLPAGGSTALVLVAGFFTGWIAGAPEFVLLLVLYAAVIAAIAGDVRGEVSPIVRAIAPLSQLTYSLYMVHYVWLLFAVEVVAIRLLKFEGAALDMAVGGAVLSVVGLSYLSLELFERPMRKAITRAYARRGMVPAA
jgi:peptidoglycan/LPS O-acetylase OafA/YrhL